MMTIATCTYFLDSPSVLGGETLITTALTHEKKMTLRVSRDVAAALMPPYFDEAQITMCDQLYLMRAEINGVPLVSIRLKVVP